MKEWYSIADLIALGHKDLPQTKRGLRNLAEERNWDADRNRARETDGNGGTRREYHYTLLPHLVQAQIVTNAMIAEVGDAPSDERDLLISESLWHRFQYAAGSLKATAEKRLAPVQEVMDLSATMVKGAAISLVSIKHGIPSRTLHRWVAQVKGIRRSDWLAALLPDHGSRPKTNCHPDAWAMVSSDYLRPSEPSFASCYTRMKEAANEKGWAPIPSKKTLLRRIEAEFPAAAIIAARKGQAAAEQLFPAQTRDRSIFHAMEAVNADGHVFDVFVKFDDGSIGRPCMVGFQDLYSGMLLSHRISRMENKEVTRLAIGDMIESWGIPQHVYFDNGRAFMSKWITGGGMTHRFRFKVKDEEPKGVLTQLGVKVHKTKPYHGQSKPIERAWRDLVQNISRHPAIDGAFTGNHVDAKPENYRSRAIPIEEFRKFVAQEIMRHNTRQDRNTQTAIRGLQGVVVIDEAAYHRDVRAVIDAVNALLIWGGKEPVRAEYINDASRDVYNLFRILQEHYVAFLDHMRFQITTQAAFERLLKVDPETLTDIQRAARFLYLQRTAFGGKVKGRTFGISTDRPARFNLTTLEPDLEALHTRLSPVTITCMGYSDFITRVDRTNFLIYLDPPYYGCEGDYGKDAFSRDDFAWIAALLRKLKGDFILSINDVPEIRELFSWASLIEVKTSYSVGAGSGVSAPELVITSLDKKWVEKQLEG